jgi:prepilin-type N-terminal cleavage/methylation domain-containing protein
MSARRGEAGFTLIELLISMAIVTVVVMATITAFVSFSQNERVNRLQNESQDEARLTMERLSGQLRNLASPNDYSPKSVEKAEPYDLVFLTVDAVKPLTSANARNIKRVRYCIGPVVNGKASLIKQQQTWQVQNPPPSFSTAGCPNATWNTATEVPVEVAQDIVNTAQATPVPVFTYTPAASPTDAISAIHADFMVDWNPGQSPAATDLTSGVYLRNQNRAPVARCTATYAGTGKKVALNGSASEDPEGFNMRKYKWYADGHSTDNPADAEGVVALWEAGSSGTHTFKLVVTDQGDLPGVADCNPVLVP